MFLRMNKFSGRQNLLQKLMFSSNNFFQCSKVFEGWIMTVFVRVIEDWFVCLVPKWIICNLERRRLGIISTFLWLQTLQAEAKKRMKLWRNHIFPPSNCQNRSDLEIFPHIHTYVLFAAFNRLTNIYLNTGKTDYQAKIVGQFERRCGHSIFYSARND